MKQLAPEQIAERWNPMVAGYEEFASTCTSLYARDALRLVGVSRGQRVLDVAAGTGALALAAAACGATVLATDFSAGMVDFLRARVAERGLSNIEVEKMDGQDLSIEDGAFDAAFSVFGLMMFPDRAAGFRELERVLAPGGRAAVVSWSTPETSDFMQLLFESLQQAVPDFPQSDEPPAWLELGDPERVRSEMTDAGFENVNIYSVSHLWMLESPEWFWDHLDGFAPGMAFIFDHLDTEQRSAFGAAIIGALRKRFGAGPYALAGEAHIGLGRKRA